ncbi:MAG: hypothetical protein KTR25_04375 [Myxococcales bacterium]|nr:hypothetical protein [Myxococcales bacterium]
MSSDNNSLIKTEHFAPVVGQHGVSNASIVRFANDSCPAQFDRTNTDARKAYANIGAHNTQLRNGSR